MLMFLIIDLRTYGGLPTKLTIPEYQIRFQSTVKLYLVYLITRT